MLREFFQELVRVHQAAAAPVLIETGDPRAITYLTHEGAKRFEREPPLRAYNVFTLEDLLAAVRYHAGSAAGAIFVGVDEIVYLLNVSDRRERISLPLTQTAPYGLLQSWSAARPAQGIEQKPFLAALTNPLRGCVSQELVAASRRIESTYSGSGVSEVQHGRERGTREFQADLVGAAALPEEFAVTCSLYDEFCLPCQAAVCLTISVPPQPVRFFPSVPISELAKMRQETLGALRAHLLEELAPPNDDQLLIVCGSP